jgi:nicotinamide-nucleotide amidase
VPISGAAAPDALVVAASLHAALSARSATVATAESLTGGGLGELLSATPGASETYVGGVICYASRVKQKLLGVSDRTVTEHGVVSAECAREMAVGARALLGADFAVSTTGVAGPSEQEGKPVGLVFVGVAGPSGATAHRLELSGDRAEVRRKACLGAVSAAIRVVDGCPELEARDDGGPREVSGNG